MDIQKTVTELSGERNLFDRAIAALESLSQPACRRGRPPQSESGHGPFSGKHGGITPGDERSRQKEVISLDESALGGKEDSSIHVERDFRSAVACQCAMGRKPAKAKAKPAKRIV